MFQNVVKLKGYKVLQVQLNISAYLIWRIFAVYYVCNKEVFFMKKVIKSNKKMLHVIAAVGSDNDEQEVEERESK